MTLLYLDTETWSETPINVGVYRYAENSEILLFAFAIDDGPVQVWDMTAPGSMPTALRNALANPDTLIVAHNANFDRTLLRMARNSPRIAYEASLAIPRWRCTMARALAHGLPGALDLLCNVFRLPEDQRKQKIGKQLVRLFCCPRPKNQTLRRATRETHPTEWKQFVEYCAMDVEAMRVLYRKLPERNYTGRELDLWHLDQVINDRGICVDVPFAEAAVRAVERAQNGLAADTYNLTNGAVQAATQRDKLLAHVLEAYGVDLPDMQAATLERRIEDPDLPEELKDLLRIRLASSTVSTAKYKTLISSVSSDGRVRGTLQFCGASRTGRWAAKQLQIHNFARPNLSQEMIDIGVDAIKADCADLVFNNMMELTSNTLRGMMVAKPEHKLLVADLSNIEGRVAAWLADERWKLKAYADFDAGLGEDTYKLSYGRSFGVAPASVTRDQRQIGKVQELMLQFGAGVGGFITGAATYGVDLAVMTERAKPTIPAATWNQAQAYLDRVMSNPDPKKRNNFGLPNDVFVTCDSLKRLWREAHPNIVSYWETLYDACVNAILHKGVSYEAGKLFAICEGAWLRVLLPSGRSVCYPSPQIKGNEISYMGMNQYSHQWRRIKTYGGKCFENCVQAIARDILANGMLQSEKEGLPVVMTVHDEIVAEPLDAAYVLPNLPEDLVQIMTTSSPWATGCPLAAKGFETQRYYKG